jgi:hypothetical protein
MQSTDFRRARPWNSSPFISASIAAILWREAPDKCPVFGAPKKNVQADRVK